MGLGDWLSLVGLGIAIFQIFRTGRIVRRTQAAVERTSKQLGVYGLLVAIPELHLAERDLDRAVTEEDRASTLRALREWQARASELRGLLRTDVHTDPVFATSVQSSIALATSAKAAIEKGGDLVASTSRVRKACTTLCLEARSIGTEIRTRPPEANSDPTALEDLKALYGARSSGNKEMNDAIT